jgi:arsenite methyltransferase
MTRGASTSAVATRGSVSLSLDSEELANTYERVGTRQFEHGKILIDALAPASGERALDVGCGTGRLGAEVARRVAPGGSVIGIDPLPLRVEIASGKHPAFRAVVGQAEDLSQFEDGSFDFVYMNSVLHWIEDKARALGELHRVLRAGGRVGVNSADARRPHQSAELARRAARAAGFGDAAVANAFGTTYRVDGEALARLLVSAGFVDVDVAEHTFVDTLSGADDLLAWSQSSSFGNFLAGASSEQVERLRAALELELEALRTPRGIRLERYLVFATARRPG